MITNKDADFTEIDKYVIDDLTAVNLIEIVKIDKFNYGKYDVIINSKYGYRTPEFLNNVLALVLSFNNLSDITEIKIGTLLRLPNIDDMLFYMEENNVHYDDVVAGVNTLRPVSNKQLTINNNNTTALPKLGINLPKVKYNPETGIITY